MSKVTKKEARQQRHCRVRRKVAGTAEVPRMSVCRTSKHIYVQLIDDTAQRTLTSVSTVDADFRKAEKQADMEGAAVLGKMAAERALAADIKRVVFDRGGSKFHGRVKALAEAAREAGLQL